MRTLILFLLFISSAAYANLDKPLKAEFIDFSKIDLNKYIEPKSKEIIVEKLPSQEDPKVTTYFIFEKKINDIDKRMIMQAFDLDGDGKIDLVKHFQNKTVVREEYSLNHDGKVDEVSEYDPKTGKLLKKTLAFGATNMWKYWFKDELRLVEMDRNNDKKPDMWQHFRKGKIVKTEVDANYDGKQIKEMK
jgi:hypothetical protein